MRKEGRQTLILGGLLVVSIVAVFAGVRLYLNAQETVKIPAGYTAYQYIQTLYAADRNQDNQINSLDYASVLNRNGQKYAVKQGRFGKEVNALERSFIVDNLGVNISQKKNAIFNDPTAGRKYAQGLVLALESKLPESVFSADDREYNSKLGSGVLGATTGSETTRSGGAGTGSTGADSGRSIIPEVLGTVSSYTGSANFSYPIKVPVGPGGFAPSLSLSYSSSMVDDGLPQDDQFVSGVDDKGNPVTSYYYKKPSSYTPSYAGYGFSLSGAGSITRDTRQEKEVPFLKQQPYHRFILSLPTGLSVQLKYNTETMTWVSVPQGFVKIERHGSPQIKSDSRFDFSFVDPDSWIITTSDGSRYYFGEDDLGSRITKEGQIAGSKALTTRSTQKTNCDSNGKCTETQIDALHHTITQSGGIFNEFDIADLCTGDSVNEPCRSRISNKKPTLLVTKWLLKRIESSDGKEINYSYDNYQKAYGQYYKKDWGNSLKFATVDSYLRKVEWNDAKYRVLFNTEARPDQGGTQFISPIRLSSVDVESQTPTSSEYSLMRRYKLGYTNDNDSMAAGSQNPWNISLLKTLREYGFDGTTSMSPITFQYRQYGFHDGSSGSTVYLDTINNGLGGSTVYTYEPFEHSFFSGDGDGSSGLKRVRVIEKKIVDKTSSNKSYRETYSYFNSQSAFVDRVRGKKASGREFLGHGKVEIKTYDFNSNAVLAHTKTTFNQYIKTDGIRKIHCDGNNHCEKVPGIVCFEPHLAKGQVSEQIMYNDVPSGSIEAIKNTLTYNYRILGQDKNGDPLITQDGLDPNTKQCTGSQLNQPYFVYNKSTTVTASEPKDANFVPKNLERVLTEKPVVTKSTGTLVLGVDLFGNITKTVALGDIDASGKDLSTNDNRYSYGYFLTGNPYWLNNLSYASYSSNKADCAYTDSACQYGRTNTWFDVFYGDFSTITPDTQRPKIGLITQTQSILDDKTTAFFGQQYLRLSDKAQDQDNDPNNDSTDTRFGGVIKTFGPKQNIVTMDPKNVAKDITQLSITTYDPFFKTLITQVQNAKGQKTKFEDFNYLLQVPQTIKKQINTSPEKYTASRGTFDALGRPLASYGPDPKNPENTVSYPSTLSYYFDRGDSGLVTRSMNLVSQTPDGKIHYMTSDNFYDGLGKVKQSQVLSKQVDGTAKKIVQDVVYNALGQQPETYEVQTADAVTVDPKNISAVSPQLAQVSHKVVSKTQFDTINRPVESTAFDSETNASLTAKTFYAVNAVKTVNPKGVVSIVTTDTLGRAINSLTIDPIGDDHMLTTNEYAYEMIDKPSTTTYKALKDVKGGNMTSASVKYDKAGRIISQNEPSLGTMDFTYYVQGTTFQELRRSKPIVTYVYDELGRNTRIAYPNEQSGELYKNTNSQDTIFTYDDKENSIGKITSVTEHNGREEYTYDALGRQTFVTKKIKSKTYTSSVEFNDISAPKLTKYPNGKVITTEYNEEGQAVKTLLDGKTIALNPVFDKFGNTKESSFVLGASTYLNRTTRDGMQRLREIGVARQNDGSGLPAGQQVYYQKLTYDTVSDLTNVTESTYKDGRETKVDYVYTYDGFSRLVGARAPIFNTSYAYDPFGRMGSKNEDQAVTIGFDNRFPFFAPKSVTKRLPGIIALPTPRTDTIPTDIPPTITSAPSATVTPFPTVPVTVEPSSSPTPSTVPSLTPTPYEGEPTPTSRPDAPRGFAAIEPQTGGKLVTYEFAYDQDTGNMLEDEKHCFKYNRLNQLMSMSIKTDANQRCSFNPQFKKLIYFYYDASGVLVLQEEYSPSNDQRPTKQTYYIGNYEEEYTN